MGFNLGFKGLRKTGDTEKGSTRSHSVGNLLQKRLWTYHQTDKSLNEYALAICRFCYSNVKADGTYVYHYVLEGHETLQLLAVTSTSPLT